MAAGGSAGSTAPKCHPANRAFHDHLDSLRLDAGSKGYYSQQRTYTKALQALRRYPLPLRTPQEVADLEGMGKACCRIFEECKRWLPSAEATEEEERLWRQSCKKRLAKAMKEAAKGKSSTVPRVPLRLKGPKAARGARGRGAKGKGRGRGRGAKGKLPVPSVPTDDDQPLSQLLATPQRQPSVPSWGSPAASVGSSPMPLQDSSPIAKTQSPQLQHLEFQGPAEKTPPRRKLRRSISAPSEAPALEAGAKASAKRQLVATRSDPLPKLPKPRLAPQAAPMELKRLDAPGKLVMLLDHREVGASKDHSLKGAMLSELQKRLGDADSVEPRNLPLGDVLWIWRNEATGEELVTGWIVERKTFADLSSSICDGRYEEQKARLLDAPNIQGVLFLIEGNGVLFGAEDGARGGRGFGQRLGPRLSEKALATSAAHTQLISGFNVLHSASTPHTISLLAAFHTVLATAPTGDFRGVIYEDFAERTQKHGQRRVFEAFGRMLRMVPGCGAEATEAIVDEFQTPQAFACALRDCSDIELLRRLKQRGGRVTQPVLQHCRRLYGGA